MLHLLTLLLASSATAQTPIPTLPAGCEDQPTSYPITDFSWRNSTRNLDCTVGHSEADRVCWRSGPNGEQLVCDPDQDPTCGPFERCPKVCITGVPDQPPGYGPPDLVQWFVPALYGNTACRSKNPGNPGNIRTYNVGDGRVECGCARCGSTFVGSSNSDEGETGRIVLGQTRTCGGKSREFGYEAIFELSCSRDVVGNATCTAPTDLVANLYQFTQ